MADTKIEWADKVWNPVVGCSVISPGCTNCYAMRMAGRLEAMGQPIYQGLTTKTKAGYVWNGKVETSNWGQMTAPLHWKKPRRIFVNSMSDLFHDGLPDAVIDQVFAVMALCPQHTFQILSKRSARMKSYVSSPETADRIAALVYNARHEQGRTHPVSSHGGRTRNRHRGSDMAHQEAPRETAPEGRERLPEGRRPDRLSEGARGVCGPERLSADHHNDRRRENSDRSPQGYLDPPPWGNSRQIDNQSQERCEVGQSDNQPGTGDSFGAAPARYPGSECQSQSPDREQTPKNTTHRSRCNPDALDEGSGDDGNRDSRSLSDEAAGRLSDLQSENLDAHLVWPLPGVWLGVSVEDQQRADERIPDLLATPAAVRFLSCEPLLGPIDLNRVHETFDDGRGHSWESCLNGKRFDPWSDGDLSGMPKVDWVICGGESGPRKRPTDPDWHRSLRDQCKAVGVAFYEKQIDKVQPIPVDLVIREFPKVSA